MFWFSFLGVLFLDQLSKWYIRSNFALGQSLPVAGRWLQIVYRENAGAAFGILAGARWLFVAISIVSVALAVVLYPKVQHLGWYVVMALGLVAGGALGNVIDRVHHVTVTDFICVRYFPAVFNVADSAIVVGAFILGIALTVYSQRMN
ncbi:MAG: signal peptidase II [Bacillota bacterium]